MRKAKLFSLLLDGSTDAGNVENELLLVVWFDKDGVDEKVYTGTSYLGICRPVTAIALGIFDVAQVAVQKLGSNVPNWLGLEMTVLLLTLQVLA